MCERIVAKTSVRMLLSLLLIFGSVNPAMSVLRKGETSLGTSFESYFPLKEIRLSDGPFLDLQQKGKEYLLWLNLCFIFIGLKRDCHRKPDLMPAGSRKTYGEQARFGVDFLGSIFLPYR